MNNKIRIFNQFAKLRSLTVLDEELTYLDDTHFTKKGYQILLVKDKVGAMITKYAAYGQTLFFDKDADERCLIFDSTEKNDEINSLQYYINDIVIGVGAKDANKYGEAYVCVRKVTGTYICDKKGVFSPFCIEVEKENTVHLIGSVVFDASKDWNDSIKDIVIDSHLIQLAGMSYDIAMLNECDMEIKNIDTSGPLSEVPEVNEF